MGKRSWDWDKNPQTQIGAFSNVLCWTTHIACVRKWTEVPESGADRQNNGAQALSKEMQIQKPWLKSLSTEFIQLEWIWLLWWTNSKGQNGPFPCLFHHWHIIHIKNGYICDYTDERILAQSVIYGCITSHSSNNTVIILIIIWVGEVLLVVWAGSAGAGWARMASLVWALSLGHWTGRVSLLWLLISRRLGLTSLHAGTSPLSNSEL